MQVKKGELLFQVDIPGRVGIKKNARKLFKDNYGRMRSTPSEKYQNWEAVAQAFVAQARRDSKLQLPMLIPIYAYFEFHFKNGKSLPDTSNCVEGPQDLLQKMRVYSDDKQIVALEAYRGITGGDKVVIKLYEATE